MKSEGRRCRVERVAVSGAELWTETSGSGVPVVLAHGGPGMSDNLAAVASMIDDIATVHRYDQRACGRSSGSADGQTVTSAIADMDALRRHWGYDRWFVGGHSWGAALALFYAMEHPEQVAGVIYMSGPGLERIASPSARTRAERLTPDERAALALAKTRAASGDVEAAEAVARLAWITDFSDRRNVPDFDTRPLFEFPRNDQVAVELSRSAEGRLADSGLRDTLRQLVMPVLVLHGRDDPSPYEAGASLAHLLPTSELAVIDDAGHTPWLEQPAAVTKAMRDFLSKSL